MYVLVYEEEVFEILTSYIYLVQDGYTAFQYACCNGYAPVVKLLLERGADIHYKDEVR